MFTSQYRTNKFGNKKAEFGGRIYHSKFESEVAADLELARKASRKEERVTDIVPQYRVSLDVNGYHICNYIMDFFVTYADGHQEMIEAKGFETEVWRLKWKLMEAIYSKEHPEILLKIIKCGKNKNYNSFGWKRKFARAR